MSDFWKEYSKSFMIFSQYCSYTDWADILKRIANEIASSNKSNSLSIIDVGTGYGKNINEIMEILFTNNRIRNILDVVEPSNQIHSIIRSLITDFKDDGYLRNLFSNISNFEDKKYDVILFMHSSYYIHDFNNILFKLCSNNLHENGKILILSLPDTSPFFLKKSDLSLPNTSTSIKVFLERISIGYNSYPFSSKFFFNDKFLLSEKTCDHLYHFFTRKLIEKDEFVECIKKVCKNGVIDFNDELIIIRKS